MEPPEPGGFATLATTRESGVSPFHVSILPTSLRVAASVNARLDFSSASLTGYSG